MARRIETIGCGEVAAGAERLPLTVRLDPRARRLTLRLIGEGVRVTCPGKRHVRAAVALAHDRSAWIAERRAARPERVPLAVGAVLPVFGADRLVRAAPRASAAARLEADSIVTGGADGAAVSRRVERLLRAETRERLAALADGYADRLDLPPCPVAVRETRSRWGSCSATPAISFSWRLCFAPEAVMAYVAAHEVAHRRHMDHSREFWAVVARLMPDWREADDWLKANGARLHAFG